ncbi:hypothetical protein ANN_23110, partial [Periplaneta americana]
FFLVELFNSFSLQQVLVHDPYDYPDVNTVKKFVPLRSDLFFSIPPWVTYSTPEVRDIPIKNRGLRGCLFPDEVELRKMKSYSYNNCITECRENYTIQICGCTPFYYPNNGGYRICNLTDVPCLAKNKSSLGGLLSLFIGFSLIGAVEIFYFFTFRLYYKIRARTARQHLSSSRNRIIQNIRRGEYSQFNITNPVQHFHFSHYRNFRNNNNI